MILSRVDPQGHLHCVGEGARKHGAKEIMDIMLPAGTYVLIIRVLWNQSHINQYCFNAYTSAPLEFMRVNDIDEFRVVAETLKDYCREHKELHESLPGGSPMLRTIAERNENFGYSYKYFYNNPAYGGADYLDITINPHIDDAEFAYPRCALSPHFCLGPGDDAMVVLKSKGAGIPPGLGFSVSRGREPEVPFEDDQEFPTLLFSLLEHSLTQRPIIPDERIPPFWLAGWQFVRGNSQLLSDIAVT